MSCEAHAGRLGGGTAARSPGTPAGRARRPAGRRRGPCRRRGPARGCTPRSATSSARRAFCSTSSTVTPRWRPIACDHLRRSAATTIGASPSDGSSSRSRRGSPISARPIASICCWPPLSVPAICSRRSARIGNISKTKSSVSARAPAGRRGVGADLEVFEHAHPAEQPPPLGHQDDAALDDRGAAASVWIGRAVERDGAGGRPVQAHDRPHQRRLAGAVRPDQRDDLALLDLQRDVPERLHVAVVGIDAADLEHRRGGVRHGRRPPPRRGRCPGRRRSRAGRRRPRPGVPSAIFSPAFSTTTRSERPKTALTRCSTITIVTPEARIRRIRSIATSTSDGLRPGQQLVDQQQRRPRRQRAAPAPAACGRPASGCLASSARPVGQARPAPSTSSASASACRREPAALAAVDAARRRRCPAR